MKFDTPLIGGRLVHRYKRFLADVELASGKTVTAHCANPGAMEGLKAPGLKVWLSKSEDPKRKLAYSWELAELETSPHDEPVLVGINTARPNQLVEEALRKGVFPEFLGFTSIKREVRYGRASRIDFLMTADNGDRCYLEVKNAHLLRTPGLAEFPDTRTTRGAKHMQELAEMVSEGHRAVTLYVVQRSDASAFAIATDKDPDYACAFEAARKRGVEVLVRGCSLSLQRIAIGHPLEFTCKP